MTREEFIEEWRAYWVGVAVCGSIDDENEGPRAKGLRVHKIPRTVERKLGLMFNMIMKGTTSGNGKSVGPLPVKDYRRD